MKKILKVLCCIVLSLSILIGSIVVSGGSVEAASSTARNNPFYYRYEEDQFKYRRKTEITKSMADSASVIYSTIGNIIGTVPEIGGGMSIAFSVVSYIADPIAGKVGTLEVWSAERRKIATSVITGKSHIADRWALIRVRFTDASTKAVIERNTKVRIR